MHRALPFIVAGFLAVCRMNLSIREIVVFAPLIAGAFWIGLYPEPFFDILDSPVAQIVECVRPGYYAERYMRNPLASIPARYFAPPSRLPLSTARLICTSMQHEADPAGSGAPGAV